MDLSGKYDKTNLLGDGEVQVWRGREKARGTPVLLHTFTGSPKLLRLATEYLLKRPPSSPLLDIGEWDSATCLVTLSELDMLDVTAWLENAVTAGPTAAPEPPRPAPRVESTGPVPILKPDIAPAMKPTTSPSPTPQGPGEFTRAFQIPGANVSPPRLPDPIATSGPTKTPAGPAQRPVPTSSPNPSTNPAPQGPGEFTRAFQIPTANVPPQRLPDPIASSGPSKAPAGPGEFTQLFRLPEQTGNRETVKPPELGLPSSPPDLHSPAPRSAGEFTRLFRAQPSQNPPEDFSVSSGAPKQAFPPPELPAEAVPPKLSMATGPTPLPPRSAPPEPKGPGEYTRVMQTPSLQTPQAPAAPSPASAQAVQVPMPAVPSMPSVPSPPSLPTASIPSAPSVPSAPSLPSVPSAPSSIPVPTGQRPAISPVVLLLGGLILVALILVLVFALRR